MQESMQCTPVNHGTATDAGADGQIDQWVISLPGTVCDLSEGCCVDIGVHGYWHPKRGMQNVDNRASLPGKLRRREKITIGGRCPIKVDWAKRGQAKTPQSIRLKEADHLFQRLSRCGGGNPGRGLNVLRRRPDRTDEFRAARFDAAVQVRSRSHI